MKTYYVYIVRTWQTRNKRWSTGFGATDDLPQTFSDRDIAWFSVEAKSRDEASLAEAGVGAFPRGR